LDFGLLQNLYAAYPRLLSWQASEASVLPCFDRGLTHNSVATAMRGLLHHDFTLARILFLIKNSTAGGIVSVSLSRGYPLRALPGYQPALSPDFPDLIRTFLSSD